MKKKMENVQNLKRNTIDYDFNAKHQRNRVTLLRTLQKIKQCENLKSITVFTSASKGYHICLICNSDTCDMCRFLYDDPNRYRKDLKRESYASNVLWTEKYAKI